jgi:hypothetical protein
MKQGIIARAAASLALVATLSLAAPAVAHAADASVRHAAREDGRSWASSLWHQLADLILGGGAPARPVAPSGRHGVVTAGQGIASGSVPSPDLGPGLNPDG